MDGCVCAWADRSVGLSMSIQFRLGPKDYMVLRDLTAVAIEIDISMISLNNPSDKIIDAFTNSLSFNISQKNCAQ